MAEEELTAWKCFVSMQSSIIESWSKCFGSLLYISACVLICVHAYICMCVLFSNAVAMVSDNNLKSTSPFCAKVFSVNATS